MSTCPENDIHSVYLDNELPMAYVADYKAHVESCPKCRAILDALKKQRELLSADSKTLELSPEQMNSSFERLQARLSYSRVVKPQEKKVLTLKNAFSVLRYAGVGVAAALVVAFVLPMRQKSAQSSTAQATPAASFQPVARRSMALPARSHIPLDGEVAATSLATLFSDDSDMISAEGGQPIEPFNVSLKVGDGYLVKPYNRGMHAANRPSLSLASYDVFTPVDCESELLPEGSDSKTGGVSFKFNSPLGVISLEIGSGN